MTTFADLEAENAKLRAELVELRELYTEAVEKLGTAAALVGFESDKCLPVIVDQVHVAMMVVPDRTQRTIEAAARWLERQVKPVMGSSSPIQGIEKTPDSWTAYARDAEELLVAINRRP